MSINLLRRQYESTPQRGHMWGCEFASNRDVIYWLKRAGFPGRKSNILNIPWMNGQYNYVGRPDLAGEWECDLYLYEDMASYIFLEEWWSRIFDINTGIIGKEEFHKDTVSMFMLDSTGRTKTIEFIMYGTILNKFSIAGEAEMGTDETKYIAASFNYEYYRTSIGEAGLSDGTLLSVAESAVNALAGQ